MSIEPTYIGEETIIFRKCPVHGCNHMIEANSHALLVSNLHDHLSSHKWSEKRKFM